MKTWSSTASATLVQKRRGLWIKWSELYAQMLVYFFPDVSLSIAWEGWLGSLLKPWDECCTSSLSVFGFQCLLPFFKKGVHNVSYTFQWAGRTHAKQEQKNWRQSPPFCFILPIAYICYLSWLDMIYQWSHPHLVCFSYQQYERLVQKSIGMILLFSTPKSTFKQQWQPAGCLFSSMLSSLHGHNCSVRCQWKYCMCTSKYPSTHILAC